MTGIKARERSERYPTTTTTNGQRERASREGNTHAPTHPYPNKDDTETRRTEQAGQRGMSLHHYDGHTLEAN